ncbi:MAG: hypothetical protein LBD13_01335 [Spirochaetaceae bacterium]|jgi:uncharacterized membrane protein|nr:hypothetical protein [Spirochaetaceae bacterium]
MILEAHEQTLNEVLTKLKTSEAYSNELMISLERLSKQNEDLKNYNEQIGERMFERDLDLVDAYDKINRLEKTALKLTIAAVCLAGALAVMVILAIRRFIF